MKAEELRIGNYVFGLNMEEPVRRINDSIEYNYKTEKYELDAIDILCFEPILLTEEWLLKFGFEWDDIVTKTTGETEKMLYKNILLMQRHHDTHWVAAPYGYLLNVHRTVYVHQLQNLYFALTGEELTIKDSASKTL